MPVSAASSAFGNLKQTKIDLPTATAVWVLSIAKLSVLRYGIMIQYAFFSFLINHESILQIIREKSQIALHKVLLKGIKKNILKRMQMEFIDANFLCRIIILQ